MQRVPIAILELLLVLLLAIYVWGLIWMSDLILSNTVSGYVAGNLSFAGMGIFVIVSFAFARIARGRNWTQLRNYFLAALSLFLPLVFLSSGIAALSGTTDQIAASYVMSYCDSPNLCGEAFAQMTYASSVRALPAVLTVPVLYWFVMFKLVPRVIPPSLGKI